MAGKSTILFVCNEINYNIYNRRSAIDSILKSILDDLSSDYEILINGIGLESNKNATTQVVSRNPLKRLLIRLIPLGIRERIKMKKLLNHSTTLTENIKSLPIKPDLVFELYKLGSDSGKELAAHFNCPYLIYYDSPVVEQYEDIWKISIPYRDVFESRHRTSIEKADMIIAYSSPVSDYLKNLGAKGKIECFVTLDYSRLTQVPHQSGSKLTIGFIGSFMPWHRVDMLIRTFDELCTERNNIELLLIGSGETLEDMKLLAAGLNSSNDIHFTGFVDGADLQKVKAQIDIGVMPGSNWYGIPTKVFEYGACGIASVAPGTPTIEDIFKGNEIALFDWENQEDFLNTLRNVVDNKEYREELGHQIQARINSDFNLKTASSTYRRIMKSLITNFVTHEN